MSVNIEQIVKDIEDAVAKGVIDVKAVEPLVNKALDILTLAEPLVPQIAPVVTVVRQVENLVNEAIAKL
ncbi:hypothetical protein DQP57_00315 [Mycobacterium colombiense]|uniref:Uncharacterized protein n=1 Tax=Mycobacterium colombiense TaxID=339268 RepID=A0A329MFR9_9MYCO|nr:hypothetical protein [Mycobacterium colombiense]RAV17503.1 hypothetical protein DQP57_00315 [Mycobacterium colombiense]